MKKIATISIFIIFLGLSNVYSQTVNDIPLKDIDVEYVQIIGTSKLLSTKFLIQLDFGQRQKLLTGGTILKDKQGEKLDFNSMMDALNFMADNGFELVNSYANTFSGFNVYHYILKRKNE